MVSVRVCVLQVQVTLLDKNDSPPKFGSDLYELSVPENSESGEIVSTVVAMDADESGTVTYTIKDGAEKKFDIDPLKGKNVGACVRIYYSCNVWCSIYRACIHAILGNYTCMQHTDTCCVRLCARYIRLCHTVCTLCQAVCTLCHTVCTLHAMSGCVHTVCMLCQAVCTLYQAVCTLCTLCQTVSHCVQTVSGYVRLCHADIGCVMVLSS